MKTFAAVERDFVREKSCRTSNLSGSTSPLGLIHCEFRPGNDHAEQ